MTISKEQIDQVVFEYNEVQIPLRKKDGYVSLTALAKATKKKVNNYLQNKTTSEYLQALSTSEQIPIENLINIVQGGMAQNQGTYAHHLVALDFAYWANKNFAVWMNKTIEKWLNSHSLDVADNPVTQLQCQYPINTKYMDTDQLLLSSSNADILNNAIQLQEAALGVLKMEREAAEDLTEVERKILMEVRLNALTLVKDKWQKLSSSQEGKWLTVEEDVVTAPKIGEFITVK